MIALGCDHGGYELKQEIIKYLEEKNIPYKDFGCHSTEAVDYQQQTAFDLDFADVKGQENVKRVS